MQLEYEKESNESLKNVKSLTVINLPNAKLTDDCIGDLLKLSIDNDVEFIQMFDVTMLLGNAAFDDITVMECVEEKLKEWKEYARSMAIFDVDSLIGVTENISDSSLGQSSSYSITNNRLWHQVVIQTANTKLASGNRANEHRWVVVITKSKFICKQFKSLAKFPFTNKEQDELNDSNKQRECLNCGVKFVNSKNSIEACQYHDGPLVDISLNRDEWFHITRENMNPIFANANSETRKDMFKDYSYLCCFQGYNSTGCKRYFHSDSDDLKNINKYLNN